MSSSRVSSPGYPDRLAVSAPIRLRARHAIRSARRCAYRSAAAWQGIASAYPPLRNVNEWDPCPFILIHLFLSPQAACTAPMLMMSQNRLAARDRLEAHSDYEINRKAEEGGESQD